ncbi:MAG TPA: ROK family protein [Streptosporangiaceae bacterium]|nr:ROK family protein [Streptosporangiaceae bacterium]
MEKSSPPNSVAHTTAAKTTVATTTAVVRVINERAVYEQIRRLGTASASQLVAATGLSKATIGLAFGSLERVGLISQVGHRVGQVGRAPRLYEIRPDAGRAMAVDVGASWIRLAVADLSGTITARADHRVRTLAASALADQIGELARATAAEAGVTLADITHTVLGFPGIYEPDADRITAAPNLPGWEEPGSVSALRAELGPRFSIDNDVNLATVAEQEHGAGAGTDNFVFVSVGTGIGMGIVIDGELYRGSSGRAGEISYLPVGAGLGDGLGAGLSDGPGDGPGQLLAPDVRQHGILETVASADGVLSAARRLGLTASSTEQVFDAARSGDQAAIQVVHDEASHLARALAAVIAVLDPGLIVIGGGVGGNADLLLDPTKQLLGDLLALSPPPIEMSVLGRDAVVLGGLAAGLDRARDDVLAHIQA